MNGRERPSTARQGGRFDMSASAARASVAAPADREADLFRGYSRIGPRRRTEPCMCGQDITAEVGWEHAAVEEHNRTPVHRAWSAWRQQQTGADSLPSIVA